MPACRAYDDTILDFYSGVRESGNSIALATEPAGPVCLVFVESTTADVHGAGATVSTYYSASAARSNDGVVTDRTIIYVQNTAVIRDTASVRRCPVAGYRAVPKQNRAYIQVCGAATDLRNPSSD
jgi:hypothetical protein